MAGINFNVQQAITPSATVNLPQIGGRECCDAIFVGSAGVVDVVSQDGTVTSHTAVAGELLFTKAKRVNATSTATLMVAQWQI